MNRTHLEHAIYAMLMQAVIALVTSDWWLGAAFSVAFFVGREHAQAERRCIDMLRDMPSDTVLLPELRALHPRYWNRDSMLDWIVPAVVCGTVAAFVV